MIKKKKKIVYFCNNLGYFFSHRENIVKKLINLSYDLILIYGNAGSQTIDNQYKKKIKEYNIKTYKIPMYSDLKKSIAEIKCLFLIYKIIKKIKPDIVHTISPKANLYGGLISIFFPNSKLIMSVSGLGTIFSGNYKFLSIIFILLNKVIFFKKKLNIIFHNSQDLKFYKKKFNLNKKKLFQTYGSGVDLHKFFNKISPQKKNILFCGRILKTKGVLDFIEASKILKNDLKEWRFLIAGPTDYQNPDSIDIKFLKTKTEFNNIKYVGYHENIKDLYKNCQIYCLPSYSEGLSKTLLEAASMGLPVVVSDIPGNTEAVINNKTGLIFKTGDAKDLAKKIKILASSKKIRQDFGKNNRKLALKQFSIKKIIDLHLSLYEK